MTVVVVSSYVCLSGIKAALIQSLGAQVIHGHASLLGTSGIRCALHLLGRFGHKHVRLLSCSRNISRVTHDSLRGKNPAEGAAVVLTWYHPLLYRNSPVIQCWHCIPEHCVLHSDKFITMLFLNDVSL